MRKNVEQHDKILELRSMGMSLRSIAEACGLSIPRIHQILNPYNPDGAFISYSCAKCGEKWTSKSKTKPKRCPACGTHYWAKLPANAVSSSVKVVVVEEDLSTSISEDKTND